MNIFFQFYLILNVAVGERQGYFDVCRDPNGLLKRPWSNSGRFNESVLQFYKAKPYWYQTWKESSMQVDYVKVTQKKSWEYSINNQSYVCSNGEK